MLRWKIIFKLLIFIILLTPSLVLANEVVLTSGQKLEGKITEQNNKYIKIDTGIGMAMTYYLDEIDTIDGNKAQIAQTPPTPSNDPVVVQQAAPAQAAPVQANNAPAIPLQNTPSIDINQGSSTDDTKSAQGEIQGRPFTVSQAKFDSQMNTLKLWQGEGFYPDLQFQLFLFTPKGFSWENAQLHITPDTSGLNPHIYKEWKEAGSDVPKQKVYMQGYNLDLSLGEIHDGKIHGTINLRLPDVQKSFVEGAFDASVANQSQGNQGSFTMTVNGAPVAVTSFNNKFQGGPGSMIFTNNGMNKAFSPTAAIWASLGGFAIGIVVTAIIAIWIYPALCLHFISKKTNRGVPWMAWVPIASFFLMCKVAGVRYTWLWLLLLGVIPILGMLCIFGLFVFIWYKIALTLNKPGWWGILTMIPFVNLFALGFLAFSE